MRNLVYVAVTWRWLPFYAAGPMKHQPALARLARTIEHEPRTVMCHPIKIGPFFIEKYDHGWLVFDGKLGGVACHTEVYQTK